MKKFFVFVTCIFLGKNLEFVSNAFFMNVEEEKNIKKKLFAKKNNRLFIGLKGGPFKYTKTCFLLNVFNFFNIHKNAFYTYSKLFFTKICR